MNAEPFIEAVIESANFEPAYALEGFVTVTFRVPADTTFPAGIWEIRPKEAGRRRWAQSHTRIGETNER